MQNRPRKRVGRDEMLLLHSRSLRLVCTRKRYEGPTIHACPDRDNEHQQADVFQHASPEGYSHNQHAREGEP